MRNLYFYEIAFIINLIEKPVIDKIKTVIVDDEASSVDNLRILITEFCPQIELIDVAYNLEDAKKVLYKKEVELAFLDVQFGTRKVFNLLDKMQPLDFDVIFISAHNHALKAFQFEAIDYLLKPIDLDLLIKSVKKVEKKKLLSTENLNTPISTQDIQAKKTFNKITIVTANGGYEVFAMDKISYFTAQGSYTNVYLENSRKILSSKNLKFYENLTQDFDFIRIHNSSLINKNFVKKIFKSDGGFIVMENDEKLNISASKKNDIYKIFGLV